MFYGCVTCLRHGGRICPCGGRGERDPRVGADVTPPRFAWQGRQGAMVSESRKDRFAAVTVSYDVFFKCHVVTSISSNSQNAVDATL